VFVIKSSGFSLEDQQNSVGTILADDGDDWVVQLLGQKITSSFVKSNLCEFSIEETGDEFNSKICDRCFRHLSTLNDFENNRIKKGGKITKRPSCRNCRAVKNGAPISAADKRAWNQKKPDKYSAFCCPICNKTSIVGVTKVVLDHCHKTGRVRGWVCESCNTGIGRFDDESALLERAIHWLERE
jgi:hypothetical protein